LRTYGFLKLYKGGKEGANYVIADPEPHICARIKAIFPKIDKTATRRYPFPFTDENSHELLWFTLRYPLAMSADVRAELEAGSARYLKMVEDMENVFASDYVPAEIELRPGESARSYQVQARDLWLKRKKLLLADDMGLGKTASAIFGMLSPGMVPALVVCQAHLPTQWKGEIEKFCNLRVHIIGKAKPYPLPPADVYLISYSKLTGWVDVFTNKRQRFLKSLVFDECQELRRWDSNKYRSAKAIAGTVEYCIGLSGTPVYNYGDEIYNVLDCMDDGTLGPRDEFLREWCSWNGKNYPVKDPVALGSYLRESYRMLRRTRADVGRELPAVNKIVHTVAHDEKLAADSLALARQLAIRATTGSFMERGQASRELDTLLRHATGVAKARGVAAFVRLLMDAGQPVLLAGWHRDVYKIWEEELGEYKPSFYTGSESPTAKNEAKRRFLDGETNLLIMSLRSGVGVDGIQHRCRDVVYGELDWSPKVHDQFTARADRDGQEEQVNAYYLVADWGADPTMIDVLGVKSMQSHGILDRLLVAPTTTTDESRLQKLAEQFLTKKSV
jgi:hypothetical protein